MLLCFILIFLLANMVMFATTYSSGADDFTARTIKISGRYITVNGCLVSDLSYLDQQRIAKTNDIQQKDYLFDSLQNDGYLVNGYTAEKQNVISKNIAFETSFSGQNELKFKYIYNNLNDVAILPDWNESNFHVTEINGREYDLLEYNNSIYMINIDQGIIEQVLLEDNEYNKAFIEEHISQMDNDYYQLTWGANPQPNISGNKFTYYSSRNALKGGDSISEIRVKNLDTGEDYSLGDIGYECLGWDINDNVYYFNYDEDIVSINVNNGEMKTVLTGANPRSILLYPYIAYSTEKNYGIVLYNIANGSTENFNSSNIQAISGLYSNPAKTSVLFQNDFYSLGSDLTKAPAINLGIFNINDKIIRFLDMPDGFTLQRYSWINNEIISLILLSTDTYEENTYLVDMSCFKEIE